MSKFFEHITESVWSDIQDRSSGEVTRTEDDPYKNWDLENITKDEFYDYLTTYYEPIESHIYKSNEAIDIPIYVSKGFHHLTVSYNKDNDIWCVSSICTPSLKNILMSEYRLFPINKQTGYYLINPKDEKLTHKFCIELLDYILKNVDRPLLKKVKGVSESVWSDIQDRSTGEVTRKEDEINLEDFEFIILSGAASRALFDAYSPDDNSKEGLIKYIEDRKKEHRYAYQGKKLEDYTYDRMIKYIDQHWGDCKDIKQFIDECIPDTDTLTESVWSDIQDRSSGEKERKEDEIPESIKEALAAYIDVFVHYVAGAGEYTIGSCPDFKAFIKDFANKPRISNIDFDMDELLDYVEDHWDYILDIILKTMEAYDKQIDDIYGQIQSDLEKGEVKESVWSDIQDRSSGEKERKEDDVNLLDKEGLYEYIKKKYENKVEWMQSAATTIVIEPIEKIYLSLNYRYNASSPFIIWSGRVDMPYVSMSFLKKLEERFKLRHHGYYEKIVTEKDGTINNQTFIDFVDMFMENKDNILNESVWSDIQDRSSGEKERKEDDVNLLNDKAFTEYLKDTYTVNDPITSFEIYIDGAGEITLPVFEYDMGTRSIEFMYYTPKEKKILIGDWFCHWDDKLMDKIKKTYTTFKYHTSYTDYIRIYPKKGEINNSFFLEVLDFILENANRFYHRLLVKNIKESVWSDIQDRSSGEVVRKEDDVNLLGVDGFYDYLQKHYECTASFFDKSGNGVITVPLYIMDNHQGFSHLYISYYGDGLNNISDIRFRSLDYISKVLKEHNLKLVKFGPFTMVSPEDGGQLDNKLCLKVIDLIISTAKRPILKKVEGLDECDGVPGGLTPGDVGGMGAITFPGPNGEPGSGDIPMPTGKVYQQVAPFGIFVNSLYGKRKKKKKKKFRKEDEPCVHSPNAKVYAYVDDFRDYVDRTYNIMDRR